MTTMNSHDIPTAMAGSVDVAVAASDADREIAATSMLVALLHACYTCGEFGGASGGDSGADSGRSGPNPISLARLRKLTGVPMSTVRRELVNMEANGLAVVTMREATMGGTIALTELGMKVCAELFAPAP
jgi:hypothetical protein